MKRIVVLGSTGTIGRQTLEVVRRFPDRFRVVGLAAKTQGALLAEQVREFCPEAVAIWESSAAQPLRQQVNGRTEVLVGDEGINRIASWPSADLVMVAIGGAKALMPLLGAIQAKKQIALANKEALVMAGELVMAEVRRHRVQLVPVDSEHNALFQCLHGHRTHDIKRLYLHGSGGPFRTTPPAQLARVTPEQALQHPRWKMGKKITIDSATLMNKGFEIVEAHWLFECPIDRIEVLIHPEAIVHSMVEFVDGMILAQLGAADMRLPIQYALTYPERLETTVPSLDFAQLGQLTFEPPDLKKFPCLTLAQQAAREQGVAPAVLNAANEELVEAFLDRRIRFLDLPNLLAQVVAEHHRVAHPSLEEIVEADRWGREATKELIACCRR